MRDTIKNKWPSYPQPETNLTGHSRASLGTSNNRSKSNHRQNVNPAHHWREISPPPLKRKRTAYEESHKGQAPVSLPTLGTSNSLLGQPIDVRSSHKPSARPLQILDSFQALHSHHAHGAQIHSASSLRKIPDSYKQSPNLGSRKPACRVCDKTTATSYNPIIACPGCARPYHDSCRKPSLPQGVDPQRWRCSTCSNRSGKPANPMLLSKPVLFRSSGVKDILKPPYARSLIVDSARLSDGTALDKKVHTQTFPASAASARWSGGLDRPKQDFESPLQSVHSENLSTPARCSTQPLRLGSSSQQRHAQAQNGPPAASSLGRARSRTPITSCSGCRQASVVVRPGDENSQCESCRNESCVEDIRRLEIPETPNAAAPYDIAYLTSSTDSAASLIAYSPTTEAERPSRLDPNRKSTLDHTSTKPLHNDQQREDDHWKAGASKTIQESNLPASGSPVIRETEDTHMLLSPRCSHVPSTNHATMRISYSEQQELGAMSLESSPKTGNLSVPLNMSTSPEVDDDDLYMRQRRHSNRDLARIALACANGSSMSAPQIIDWLVRHFPYLQQGQALWEESLKATLSLQEFCSNKAIGLDDARVVYSFANEAYRTRYEEEYRGYIIHYSQRDVQKQILQPAAVPSIGNSRETIESVPEQHCRDRLGESTRSVPTRYDKDIRGIAPKCAASSQQSTDSIIPSPASNSFNDSTLPRPLTPSELSLARNKVECVPKIKRETSFHKAYPRSIRTSLEMMTAEEKARKVAEIRARPSRKQLINSGQRLAHVRRYRRQDPHDESDGAWKPQYAEVEEKPMDDARDCDEPRSLLKVFRLPTNAVPMLYEGNELAFRDGTMVNGRLPRPRRIYRVGKRLGAGFTVN